MVRTGARRALDVGLLLAAVAIPAVLLALAAALPRADLAAAGLDWVVPALAGALAAAASVAGIAGVAIGLRTGAVAALVGASSAAAVAGAALSIPLTGQSAGVAPGLAVAAVLLVGAGAADELDLVLAGRGSRLSLAAIGMLAAEASVIVALLPATASIVEAWREALLVAAAVAFALVAVAARDRWLAAAGAGATVASVGFLLGRGGDGLEPVIAILTLIGASVAGLPAVIERADRPAEDGLDGIALPPLVHYLSEAVLHFDGGLALRDWNPAAQALLGLDGGSRGSRLEDLLGVSIADLPAAAEAAVVTTAVGGLAVRLHRADEGVMAIIGEDRATDEERLGRELRGTIEELLQARRTIELQRAEIERASSVDPLTGVASRGAILERLRIEIAQARRYQHPVAVILIDVDDFAEINHRHGVSGGDALLREVALRVRLRVREADALGRAGSDGFLAILPHTDEAGAATFADALRRRLAQRPIPVGHELRSVTVSIGVAVMRPGEDLGLDGLLARVGEALDSARRAGGDRIALDRLHGLARLEEHRPTEADDRAEGTR